MSSVGIEADETPQLACRGLLLEKLIPHLGVCRQKILFSEELHQLFTIIFIFRNLSFNQARHTKSMEPFPGALTAHRYTNFEHGDAFSGELS